MALRRNPAIVSNYSTWPWNGTAKDGGMIPADMEPDCLGPIRAFKCRLMNYGNAIAQLAEERGLGVV